MDAIDLELLYHLDTDSRMPVKRIASRMGQNSERINYRLNNLLRDGTVKRCYAQVDPGKIGYTSFKVYLQFQNVDKAKMEEMHSFLVEKCNVGWAASCLGRWDMIIDVLARDRHDFSRIYSEFHRRHCDNILNRAIGIMLERRFINKKWLARGKPAAGVSMMAEPPLDLADKTDFAILRRLVRDSREPVKKMAASLGMPATTVSQRIRRLVEKGVIAAFRTDLDLPRFGRVLCKAFIYLSSADDAKQKEMLDYCAAHPDIIYVSKTIAPWDIEVEAHLLSFNDFTALMNSLRDRFPTVVRNFETVIISRETGSFSAFPFSGR